MKSDFGKRVLGPALIPVGAFVFIGSLVFAFSRILLAVPKDASVVVGVLMAGSILLGAGALSKGATIKAPQRAALVGFGIFLVGGGVAAAAALGTRPVEGHLEVAAKVATASQGTQFAFGTKDLALPADKAFILQFDNKDATTHNVAIYKDPAAAAAQAPAGILFKGSFVQGPKVTNYEVKKPIPKGVYFFRCDVHPGQMFGTARVGGATGPGPAGPASPGPAPSSPSPAPTAPSPSAPAGTTEALTAKGIAFDKKTLEFIANALVVINFDNQDAGIRHNFGLYKDAAYTQELFKGDPVTGTGTTSYRFPAPGPGTYYFQCDFHPLPQMRGTVTIR